MAPLEECLLTDRIGLQASHGSMPFGKDRESALPDATRRHLFSSALAWTTLLACRGVSAGMPTLLESDVSVIFENGLYTGRFSWLIPVPTSIAWDVLTDFDHMADFVPNLESSRIIARDGGSITFAQKGRVKFGIFSFGFESQRRVELRPREGLLLAQALSGTAKHMASETHLAEEENGTRLDYRIEMIPGRWYPSTLGIAGMRHEVAEQFTAIAAEMVRRTEGRRGP